MPPIDRNVYILGAGFSAAAGMPLMQDFMSSMRDLQASPTLDGASRKGVYAIDRLLKKRAALAKARDKVKLDLDNIEQLLGLIDAQAVIEGYQGLTQIQSDIRKAISCILDPQRIRSVLMRFQVRPEFHRILSNLGLIDIHHDRYNSSENHVEINPYHLFAAIITGQLDEQYDRQASDIVISFNYDLVLEESLRKFEWYAQYFPQTTATDPQHRQRFEHKDRHTPLLKLHGSINWGMNKDGIYIENPMKLIDKDVLYPVITPPTWNKSIFFSEFSELWAAALRAIAEATRIFIIGYSFPEADQHFKYFLAAGLAENTTLRSLVIINPTDLTQVCDMFLDDTFFSSRRMKRFSGTDGKFESFLGVEHRIINEMNRGKLLRN